MKLVIALFTAVLATSAAAQTQDRPTLERRVLSVGTLIESSSAARQTVAMPPTPSTSRST